MIKKLSIATAVLIASASLSSCSAPASFTESCAEFSALVAEVPFNQEAEIRAGIEELDSRASKLHEIVRGPIQEMAKISKDTPDDDAFVEAVFSTQMALTEKCPL